MTTFANTAEGGTNGANVTVGNSGGASGNPFATVAVDAAVYASLGSVTYQSAAAYRGSLGYKIAVLNPGNGDDPQCAAWVETTHTSASTMRLRFYMRALNYTTQPFQLALAQSTNGNQSYLALDTDGRLFLADVFGNTVWQSTNGLPLNTWLRVELVLTSGQARACYALGDGAAVESAVKNGTFGGSLAYYMLGKVSHPGVWTAHFDDLAADTTSTTAFIGPSSVGRLKVGASALDLRVGSATPSAVWAGTSQLWP